MFTIDRLAKLDAITHAVFKALYSGLDWLDRKYEDFLVNTTYRVVEAKAAAIDKAEDKISDLEDAQAEAAATYSEAKAKLRANFERLIECLDNARAEAEADMHAKIADAALALVAAEEAYLDAIQEAGEKLYVKVEA